MTEAVEQLLEVLRTLPGVGRKTALRYAHTLLGQPELLKKLIEALLLVQERVRLCPNCFFITEAIPCRYCLERKDSRALCVVAYPLDLLALERTGGFRGKYHVLHGVLDPLRGVTLESLRVRELLERVEREGIEEVLLALSPNQEGETTARLIATLLSRYPVRLTRLAYGIPLGTQLDYLDEGTLALALRHRAPFFGEEGEGAALGGYPPSATMDRNE